VCYEADWHDKEAKYYAAEAKFKIEDEKYEKFKAERSIRHLKLEKAHLQILKNKYYYEYEEYLDG